MRPGVLDTNIHGFNGGCNDELRTPGVEKSFPCRKFNDLHIVFIVYCGHQDDHNNDGKSLENKRRQTNAPVFFRITTFIYD